MTLTPAYGRDYKSKAAVMADFNTGKDFILADITSRYDGLPCNKASLLVNPSVKSVNIRYNGLRSVCVVKL